MESLVTANLNPLAYSFLLLMGILVITLPRKLALIPFFICTLYMTLGQAVKLMDLNFSIFRILIAIGWIRIIIRKDISSINLNVLDKAIICWSIVALLTGGLLDISTTTRDNLQHRSGQIYTALGSYFFFRFYMDDLNHVRRIIRTISLLISPLAILFLMEKASGMNMFFIFGGVPEFTMIRDGRLRCQGPFAHPILAGTLGATLLPLFFGLWFGKAKATISSLMGVVSATILTVTSASSGPLLSYLAALIAICAWPLRNNMRLIRWSIILVIVTLHIIMKAPVWYLMAKISTVIGGDGWQRSQIIDMAILHFEEWWMIGTNVTAHWDTVGVLPNVDMMDITNQYILEGVYGGLMRMILFIMIIVFAFRGIGNKLSSLKDQPTGIQFITWAIGASLFAHAVTFISVAYFDQLIALWYFLLAMISTITTTRSTVRQPAPEI